MPRARPRTAHRLPRAALGLCLLGPVAAPGEDDAALAARLVARGEIRPLAELLPRVQALRPGRVLGTELEQEAEHPGYSYAFRILAPDGRIWELELDARTGQVLERELEGH